MPDKHWQIWKMSGINARPTAATAAQTVFQVAWTRFARFRLPEHNRKKGWKMKIKRLEIKGYKSIEHLVLEDVPSLMVLAGANGAGKSNVVEALAFFGAVVRDGVNHAIKDFGGTEDIRPKNINNPESIGIVIQIEESNYMNIVQTYQIKWNW